MALTKSYTSDNGLIAKDAYHRIEEINTRHKDIILVYVHTFANSSEKLPIIVNSYQGKYDYSSKDNLLTQAYNLVKTLPEFAGAVDC